MVAPDDVWRSMKGIHMTDAEKVEKLTLDTLENSWYMKALTRRRLGRSLNTVEFQMREFNSGVSRVDCRDDAQCVKYVAV